MLHFKGSISPFPTFQMEEKNCTQDERRRCTLHKGNPCIHLWISPSKSIFIQIKRILPDFRPPIEQIIHPLDASKCSQLAFSVSGHNQVVHENRIEFLYIPLWPISFGWYSWYASIVFFNILVQFCVQKLQDRASNFMYVQEPLWRVCIHFLETVASDSLDQFGT